MTTSRDMLMAAAGAVSPQAIAVGSGTLPYIYVYAWSSTAGFGAKYSDPASLPPNQIKSVAFSPAGNALAMVYSTFSPYITAYPWSLTTGFGAKYSDPSVAPAANGNAVAFSPAADAIALATNSTPYIAAYAWSSSTGFGAKYSNPATLPTGAGYGVAFSPLGDAVAVTHGGYSYLSVYRWSSSTGFGTKYTDPATPMTNRGVGVAFSPSGNVIASTNDATPFVHAYQWSSATGFGTKYANPATLPGTQGSDVAFSPAGDVLAVAAGASPYVLAYPWSYSTGFGTAYSNPSTLPTGFGYGVAFSQSGDAIAVAHDTSPYVTAYPWSYSTGFGAKYSNPSTLPANSAQGVDFYTAPAAPSAPTGVTASIASTTSAAVYFTAGKPNGSPITSYTVTSSPGGFTASGASSPLTVTGLTTGTAYTFTVTATNSTGTSPASAASNSVTPYDSVVALGFASSPYISAYPFYSPSGFGTKYSDPSTLPGSGPIYYYGGVSFSPRNDAVAFAAGSSPYINAYAWSSSGFGAKYSNPSILPTSAGTSIAFSPAADAIVIGTDNNKVNAYQWSSSTGFGTKYADPGTPPTNAVYGVSFSPSGQYVSVTLGGSPYLTAYEWNSSTGFGYRAYLTSFTGAAGGSQGAFSPDENFIFFISNNTSGFSYPHYSPLIKRSSGPLLGSPQYFSGFGGSTNSYDVDISPDGNTVFATSSGTPKVLAWPWSNVNLAGNFGQYSAPATPPAGTPVFVRPSQDSKAVLFGSGSSPYIQGYPWNTTTGFGTKYSNPATLPTSQICGISFNSLPSAPVITTVQASAASSTSASINAVVQPKGYPITNYTATSTPGGLTASGSSLPLTVTGLTSGTAYTFTLSATNSLGTTSSVSNTVIPTIWASAALFNGFTGNLRMLSVTRSSGGRFVAVGYDTSTYAGYWSTSTDGTTWTTPSLFNYWVSSWVNQMAGVAVSPSGLFVSVGTGATSSTGPFQPRYSTSTDGTTWTAPTAFNGTARTDTMAAIACSSAGRFVAVASTSSAWGSFTTSTDGTTWTTPADFPTGTTGQFQPRAVAVNSSGRFVVVGSGYIGAGPCLAFSTSTNGTTWTAPAPIGLDSSNYGPQGYLYGIAVNSSGKFVAVGQLQVGGYPRPIYTTSDSGTAWTSPALMSQINNGLGTLQGVAVNSSGQFVAVGSNGEYAVSNDGVTWTSPAYTVTPADAVYFGVTPTSTGKFLAVGFRYSPSYAPVFTVSS